MTKEQVTEAFTRELKELLTKWGAELSAEDHFSGYAECGEDVRMTVSVPSKYDDDGNQVREHTEIDLGRYVK